MNAGTPACQQAFRTLLQCLTQRFGAPYTPFSGPADPASPFSSHLMTLPPEVRAPTRSKPPLAQATPAMRQYLEIKRQHRDAIVFCRIGDFYEMFYEDALVASRALEIALTSRSKDSSGGAIPMCGVPAHSVDQYLARLVQKGFRVAICDQVEDPRQARGVVRREVVRVVSPGTLTDAAYLDAREPAFLAAIAPGAAVAPARHPAGGKAAGAPPPGDLRGETRGVALIDISTGEFLCAEYTGEAGLQAMADELQVIRPREIVVPAGAEAAGLLPESLAEVPVTKVPDWSFEPEAARKALCAQLQTTSLEGFGLEGTRDAVRAAGALVQYLRDTQKADLQHVRGITLKQTADRLIVDAITLQHLEVFQAADGGRQGSLLHAIDRTVTAMGGRLLRGWLLRPLVQLEQIRDRLDAVEDFAFRATERGKFRDVLRSVQDIERLVSRAAMGIAGPRDLVSLRSSVAAVPRTRQVLEGMQAPLVTTLVAELDDLADVRSDIEKTLVDDPPALAREGGVIRERVDAELDRLREVSRGGKRVIAEMEERERERTGIGSLKIRFNRVFGYYIEVSRANLHLVPGDYQRKQTIAGGERFTTPALKQHEEQVVGADERILEHEIRLFDALRARVAAEAPRIQDVARGLAVLDVLAALAETAAVANYVKPHVHDADDLAITDGRHPVVERHSPEAFVPNDVALDTGAAQLVILTGPNMGGKSTYLRQTAIICIMAQAGSFVPARQARLPIVDRVFARVGASDNISRNQSTFMAEMQETSNILRSATSKSLVVLDEIGRGTATFDGLSIAWAVAEHLAGNQGARPKTLFATHYHELTELADVLPGVVNYHVAAREWRDDIIFLRKVLPGRSDRSYGIQVARLAGLPETVIARARAILAALEQDALARGGRPSLARSANEPEQRQLGLFTEPAGEKLIDRLRSVDLDQTTPLDALKLLAELKEEACE